MNGKDDHNRSHSNSLLHPEALGIDLRALSVAQHLMVANSTGNRQCHAATSSALFNLVMQSSNSASKVDGAMSLTPSVHSGQAVNKCDDSIINENASLEKLHDDNGSDEVCLHAPPVVPSTVAGWEPLVCTDPIGMYAFTVSEPVRLDTGSEYVKLPLSSFVTSDQQV